MARYFQSDRILLSYHPRQNTTITDNDTILTGIEKVVVPKAGRDVVKLCHLVRSHNISENYSPFLAFHEMPRAAKRLLSYRPTQNTIITNNDTISTGIEKAVVLRESENYSPFLPFTKCLEQQNN